ncbi:class I SAM-dependent methyltransferase, partial [bacterium]|nr:class I SAM-dependent methyltransferase [bacterium]
MSKFDADFYIRFRPFYPRGLYEEFLKRVHLAPVRCLDVGCGTGHSIVSAAQGGILGRWVGVDPDGRMLERAKELCERHHVDAQLLTGSSEDLDKLFDSGSLATRFDWIQIASAFHWMKPEETLEGVTQLLKLDGLLAIYEYQFPKCEDLPGLNEWIRKEFNL